MASRPGTEARVLTMFMDEAERWTNTMANNEFTVTVHGGAEPKVLKHKPSMVVKDPAKGVPGADLILFTVPAFAHEQYLNALKPYIKPGAVLVGMPGQAGFEFAVRGLWGDLAAQCTIMSFESLPWACRILEFGKSAEVLGVKSTLQGAVLMGRTKPAGDPREMLQHVMGDAPKMLTSGHLLGITLMATNGYLHPSIMYGMWKDWDGKPLDAPPLFYNGLDQISANTLSGASDEIMATAKAIMQQRPQVDLSNVSHIFDWFLRCYGDQISDKTSLFTCIQTNAAYKGLTHPMTEKDGKFMPNFTFRYLTEDIGFGLLAMKGVAEVAGVATPNMDKILTWAQGRLGTEFIVNGKVAGKDIAKTRCPQKYNLTTLDAILGL